MRGLMACLGCGELVRASRCPRCALRASPRRGREDDRPSPSARGYGRAWRAIRAEQLSRESWCVACGAPATDVDHVIPRRLGGPDEPDNLQSLCHSCHSRKTVAGW